MRGSWAHSTRHTHACTHHTPHTHTHTHAHKPITLHCLIQIPQFLVFRQYQFFCTFTADFYSTHSLGALSTSTTLLWVPFHLYHTTLGTLPPLPHYSGCPFNLYHATLWKLLPQYKSNGKVVLLGLSEAILLHKTKPGWVYTIKDINGWWQ